jgi:hypothetical protein
MKKYAQDKFGYREQYLTGPKLVQGSLFKRGWRPPFLKSIIIISCCLREVQAATGCLSMRRLILMNMTIMSIITITTTIIQTLDPKKRGAVAPRS